MTARRLNVEWETPVDWRGVAGQQISLFFEMRGRPHAVRLYSWELSAVAGMSS